MISSRQKFLSCKMSPFVVLQHTHNIIYHKSLCLNSHNFFSGTRKLSITYKYIFIQIIIYNYVCVSLAMPLILWYRYTHKKAHKFLYLNSHNFYLVLDSYDLYKLHIDTYIYIYIYIYIYTCTHTHHKQN